MNYNHYMHKLVQSFRDNQTTHFMFIKHYNTLLISEEELHSIVVDETSNRCLLFHEFPMHSMQGPYAPFLDWIRELYYSYFKEEQTPEEFVKNGGVYPLQQEVYASYIRTGTATRTEDLLLIELEYERQRMLQSLVNLYLYVSERRPIFIFLEKLHLANDSCINFLNELLKNEKICNIQLLAMYNEVYRVPEYITGSWKKFTREMEQRNLQYEWNSIGTETTIDVQDVLISKNAYMRAYIQNCVNMYFFLCPEDAKHYMNIVYDNMMQDVIEVEETDRVLFLEVFSLILLLNQEYTRALQMCEEVGRLGRKTKDDTTMYRYYYIAAICQFGMEKVENKVGYYIDQCQEIARRKGDDLAEYKAEVIRVLSNYNYWREVFVKQYSFQLDPQFIEQTKAYGFRNLLSRIYVYSMGEDTEQEEFNLEDSSTQKYFRMGVEIAQQLDNIDFLITAYSKNIIRFSEKGLYGYVEYLYRKMLEYVKLSGKPSRRVHVYNGLGYIASVMEKYQQAEEYYNKCLNEAIKLRDGNEAAITLYNSSVNKMLAGEYEEAAKDLNLLLQVMELLQIHFLPICETSKIYGLLGVCSFYMGEEYRCYLCLNRIDAYVRHLDYVDDEDKYRLWHGTLFLRHLLQAMLYAQENRLMEAEQEFQKADFHQEQEAVDQYFNYPLYVVEIANFYKKQKREEEWAAVLEEGINYCNSNGYHVKAGYMLSILQGKKVNRIKNAILSVREISNEELLEIVQNIAIQKKMEMSKRDIDFMVIWQELLNRDISSRDMMAQAITMMKNYFNFDGVVRIKEQQGNIMIEYFDGPESREKDTWVTKRIRALSGEDLEQIMDYFHKNKRSFLTNRIDKGFLEYREILEILGLHRIVTLYAAPSVDTKGVTNGVLLGYVEMCNNAIGNRALLMDHDFTILKYFSNQFYVALERLTYLELINCMNSQLSDMAVTDLLTGLYNRQGFEKRLKEDQQNVEGMEENVILYIDLDNFKYYNDTFGHEIGDYVLVRFAQLLERVVDNNNGYAVRYGGDEFVIVLNNQDITYAKKVAKNIFYMLADGVHSDILKRIGIDVTIPQEKLLSCSIGIASYCGHDDATMQQALNKADKGLYYVKRSTKNNYVVWDELEKQ